MPLAGHRPGCPAVRLRSSSQKNFASRQPRLQHTLIAGDDLACRHPRRPCSRPARSGPPSSRFWDQCSEKYFDASASRPRQKSAGWHVHKLPLLDGADQHAGPFRQPRHLGQQPLVRDHFQAMHERRLLDAFEDDRFAPSRHPGSHAPFQRGYRSPRTAGAPSILFCSTGNGAPRRVPPYAREAERHHLAVEGRQNGMQRPHPAGRHARLPAHRFRPAASAIQSPKLWLPPWMPFMPRAFDHSDIDLTLGRLLDLQLVFRQPGFFSGTFNRRRWGHRPPCSSIPRVPSFCFVGNPRRSPCTPRPARILFDRLAGREFASVLERRPFSRSRSLSSAAPACGREFPRCTVPTEDQASAEKTLGACRRPSGFPATPRSRLSQRPHPPDIGGAPGSR